MAAGRARNVPETTPHGKRIDQLAAPRRAHAAHFTSREPERREPEPTVTTTTVTTTTVTTTTVTTSTTTTKQIPTPHADPIPNPMKMSTNATEKHVDY